MKKPLEIIGRNVYYPAIPGFLMLAGMMLLTGCEPSSGGPPGAGSAMGPPGAPTPGVGVPGAPVPGSHITSPDRQAKKPMAVPAVANGEQKTSAIPGPGIPNPGNLPPGMPSSIPTAPVVGNGIPDASKPVDANANDKSKTGNPVSPDGAVNPMAPLSKVEQAGSIVELASEIIVAGANPFLDRLPKPVVEAVKPIDTGVTTPAAPPPADPLDSVSVLGIAYQSKSPMALLSLGGAEAQTKMVRKGDVLTVDAGQVKVAEIGPGSVELQSIGPKQDKRTLSLPSIVGYLPSSAASGKSNSSGGAGGPSLTGGAPNKVGGPADKTMPDNQNPDLPNLARISPGAPPDKSSQSLPGPGKGADVKLKEP